MGAVSEGEDVLARWTDGLLYLGNVKRVDGLKQCCLVRFEDNSEFWVLRKDIHTFASAGEDVCCVCDGPPLKEPLITCLKCRHGYHATCHSPTVDPEVDTDSWICRHCVFAVATKRGGAMKRGRFARLMQYMKLRLPYQLSSLDWDPQHLTNQQQCYCYCAGPGEWNLKMLQCARCGQWFHEACTQCLSKPLLYGDRFYEFECAVCTKGPETITRLPMTWVDLAHLVLYHLSLCCKRKYFDFDHEILSFANENWDSLLLGALSDTPRQERCHHLLAALNTHKDRFVSGKEIKKKKCLFGLQVRAPPPLASDSSPVLTEAPVSIGHRKSPQSVPCPKRVGALEPRKPKRRLPESQMCPAPVGVDHIECLPCCHGYMGGTNLYNRKTDPGFSPSSTALRPSGCWRSTTTLTTEAWGCPGTSTTTTERRSHTGCPPRSACNTQSPPTAPPSATLSTSSTLATSPLTAVAADQRTRLWGTTSRCARAAWAGDWAGQEAGRPLREAGPWQRAGEGPRRCGSWLDGSLTTGKCSTWWSGRTWACTEATERSAALTTTGSRVRVPDRVEFS